MEREKSTIQNQWEGSPGFVYFIAAGDPPVAVKIGVTVASRLASRVREHQGSNHELLRLLGAIPFRDSERPTADANQRERELHRQFAPLQRFQAGWSGSEWFTATPELLAFIRSVVTLPADLGVPESEVRPGPGLNIAPG
jgi:hypothetical protein